MTAKHQVHRYVYGGVTVAAKGVHGHQGSQRGSVAAKCLCGWEGVGLEVVEEHEELAARTRAAASSGPAAEDGEPR